MVQKKLNLLPSHFRRKPWFEALRSFRFDCSIDEEKSHKTKQLAGVMLWQCPDGDRAKVGTASWKTSEMALGPLHVPILSFPLLHTRAEVYLVGLCSGGRMDTHKEPEIRLYWVCLILRWLLSFRLCKESFIGAVCRHANQSRPWASMKTALCCNPFLT